MRWNWTRPLTRRRESKQLEDLQNLCSQISLSTGPDNWSWKLERSGIFSVSSLRTAVDDLNLKKCGMITRWNTMVPPKVRLVFWRAQMDRLPTLDNLIKRGAFNGPNICVFCKSQQENAKHIFATCTKSTDIRKMVNKWWDVLAVRGDNLNAIFGSFKGMKQASKDDIIKDAIKQAYIWVVWKGRNDEIFNGVHFSTFRAANDIQSLVFSWYCNRSSFGKSTSWLDWSCNPGSL